MTGLTWVTGLTGRELPGLPGLPGKWRCGLKPCNHFRLKPGLRRGIKKMRSIGAHCGQPGNLTSWTDPDTSSVWIANHMRGSTSLRLPSRLSGPPQHALVAPPVANRVRREWSMKLQEDRAVGAVI